MGWEEKVGELVSKCRETGYRGLLVLTGNRLRLVEYASHILEKNCLLVGDRKVRRGYCAEEISPAEYQTILGREYSNAIISTGSLLRPNILAAVAETIKTGGVLVVVGDHWSSWAIGGREGLGFYKKYLDRMIRECRNHVWIDNSRVLSYKLLSVKPSRARRKCSSKILPRELTSIARTCDQLRVLESTTRFLRSSSRCFLLVGDRGRGKSYVLGLAVSLAVYYRLIGRASLVGPTPSQLTSLVDGLLEGLETLGVVGSRKTRISRDSSSFRITGPWFYISTEHPERVKYSSLVVVDEASTVGIARIRRLARRAGKLLVATTTHGYEGSGRVFAKLVEDVLPKPLRIEHVEEPIRYLEEDPLEEWIYKVLLLKAEPPQVEYSRGATRYREYTPSELVEDYSRLRNIYSILVQAHYRNTPDNLLLLLEAPHHSLHVLELDNHPVAVIELVDESPRAPPEARIALDKIKLYSSYPNTELLSARVSRIAVTPSLQRRGLGSKLLREVEKNLERKNYDIVTTIFSRHDVIEFWAKNNYLLVYVSPRYNKYTGEKNIAMAKPLSEKGRAIIIDTHCNMKRRLLEAAPLLYRDLAAEKIAQLVSNTPKCRATKPVLSLDEEHRLAIYLDKKIELEQVVEVVRRYTVYSLLVDPPRSTSRELVAAIAYIIQGKPIDEVAEVLSLDISSTKKIVNKYATYILRKYL